MLQTDFNPMINPLLARITSDPAIFGGKPIIRGQRFAVEHLLGYLGAGPTEAEMLAIQKGIKRYSLLHEAQASRLHML